MIRDPGLVVIHAIWGIECSGYIHFKAIDVVLHVEIRLSLLSCLKSLLLGDDESFLLDHIVGLWRVISIYLKMIMLVRLYLIGDVLFLAALYSL